MARLAGGEKANEHCGGLMERTVSNCMRVEDTYLPKARISDENILA